MKERVSAVKEIIEYKNGAHSCRMTAACTIKCCPRAINGGLAVHAGL
jgi:hypothetical protein